MPIELYADGTQTTTVGTEHFLSSPNVVGVFELRLDLTPLANGDVLEVRCYGIVRTGLTPRVHLFEIFTDAQPVDARGVVFEPMTSVHAETNALRFSITQTRGSPRAIPWSVVRHS